RPSPRMRWRSSISASPRGARATRPRRAGAGRRCWRCCRPMRRSAICCSRRSRKRSEPMPFADFREFLAALKDHGELVDVDRPVALQFDVAKAMRRSAAVAGPALRFTQNGTSFSLVGGVYNSRAKALIALQADEASVLQRVLDGLGRRVKPVTVDKAPVHQNVIAGDKVD